MMDFHTAHASGDGVVGPPYQNDMYQSHPRAKRYDAGSHNFILPEQLLGPHISPAKPYENDHKCKTGAPPRDQQRGVDSGSGLGRRRTRVQH